MNNQNKPKIGSALRTSSLRNMQSGSGRTYASPYKGHGASACTTLSPGVIPHPRQKKKTPPGQRLIHYCAIAGIIVLLQGGSFFGHIQPAPGQQSTVTIVEPIAPATEQFDTEDQVKNLAISKPLRVGVFAIEPKTGRYVDIASKEAFASASIIKLPILVSLLQAIDLQALKPSQQLTIKKELVTGGSGFLQWRPIGTKVSLQEATKLMIVYSDNTATNMIIDVLGGKEKLNADFKNWGLKQTKICNWLADLPGTNKTSPYDLVCLLSRIDRGELVSKTSRAWMYDLMAHARVQTLLKPGLGPGARLAHKTGDIGSMVGDCGIVTTSDGNKYFVAMQVERPHNDLRANEFIRNASKLVYERLANTSRVSNLPDTKAAPKS